VTNALAYYTLELITAVKSFTVQALPAENFDGKVEVSFEKLFKEAFSQTGL
jgi:hypothetical protein